MTPRRTIKICETKMRSLITWHFDSVRPPRTKFNKFCMARVTIATETMTAAKKINWAPSDQQMFIDHRLGMPHDAPGSNMLFVSIQLPRTFRLKMRALRAILVAVVGSSCPDLRPQSRMLRQPRVQLVALCQNLLLISKLRPNSLKRRIAVRPSSFQSLPADSSFLNLPEPTPVSSPSIPVRGATSAIMR